MKLETFMPQGPIEAPEAFVQEADRLRTTDEEAWDANWELSRMQAAHQSMDRLAKIEGETGYMERAGRNKVSPEVLNREFPGMLEPFKQPEYFSVAKIKAETQLKQKALMEMVEAGPQDGWTKTKHFAAGIAAHAIDPAEIGLGIVTGGLFRAFGVGMAATSTVGRVGANVAENIVASVAAEGFVAADAQQTGLQYTATDFVTNTVGSAIAFEGLRFGAGRIAEGVKGFGKGLRQGLAEEAVQAIDRTATAQLAQGKKIDISPVVQELDEAIAPELAAKQTRTAVGSKERFDELNTRLEQLVERQIMDPINSKVYAEEISLVTKELRSAAPMEEPQVFFGKTSNTEFVVGEVRDPLDDSKSSIIVRDVDGKVIATLEASKIDGDESNIAVFVNEEFRRQGIASAMYDYAETRGFKIPAIDSTTVRTADGKKFREGRTSKETTKFQSIDSEASIRNLTPEEKHQRMMDIAKHEAKPERSIHFDPETAKAWNDFDQTVVSDPKVAELKALEQEYTQQLDDLVKQGFFDEDEVVSIRDDLKAVEQKNKIIETAMKAATDCVGRRG